MNRDPGHRRVLTAAFDHEDRVLEALGRLREAGYTIHDVHAPYMVHGLDRAAGLRPSRLGWVCGVAGLLGAALMGWFQIWVSAIDWPIDVGGKPFASLPAFVPVAFEAGVLLAGLSTVAALFGVSRLWPGKRVRPIHPRVTDDRFIVVLEETDATFDAREADALLSACGGFEIEERLLDGEGRVQP